VNPNTRRRYPYSKNRVYLSIVIVVLSLLLVALVLQSYPALVLQYLIYCSLSTLVFTIATFHLKRRLYPILAESQAEESETKTWPMTWKTLLLIFLMLIAPISVPLLLAGLLGGAGWFILMTSFISGVSFSEILFYLYAR